MKLLDTEIKKKLVNSLVAGPPLVMLWLLRQIYTDLAPLIPKEWFANIHPITAIKIIVLLTILNLLTFAYCAYLLFKEKEYKTPEPTIMYGLYWDYMFNPLCPSCKAPLHQEELAIYLVAQRIIPKLICPNGHFTKHLTVNGLKEHPDKIRYDLLKLNKMLIEKEP